MHPLRPVRPTLPLSRLPWAALILFLSFHDHFGGDPAVKGVLAAPMNRNQNQNIPPAHSGNTPAQSDFDWEHLAHAQPAQSDLHPNQLDHAGISPTQPEIPPDWLDLDWETQSTQSVHPNQPAHSDMHLVQLEVPPGILVHPNPDSPACQPGTPPTHDQSKTPPAQPVPAHPPRKLINLLAIVFIIIEPKSYIHSLPSPLLKLPEPFILPLYLRRTSVSNHRRDSSMQLPVKGNERWVLQGGDWFKINQPTIKRACILSFRLSPALGGLTPITEPPTQRPIIGSITFPSESTAKSEMTRFLYNLERANLRAATNLIYLAYALSEAEKGGLDVELNADWYYLVAGMLHAKGSGAGETIPKSPNGELENLYEKMLEKIMDSESRRAFPM
ncbi:hypothetical protein FB446DRAFT_380947 [Lentinula raphanica]|nr:hypothetical protein FB446DRAFT_380947 [Lentinula raphanica]